MSILQINNFVKSWKDHGYEKGEKDSFWIDFLEKIFNISNWREYIKFELPIAGGFIDAYFKDTRVIIEQKSSSVKLDDSVFEQAKNYDNALNISRKARWIVTCNFKEFLIYDMDKNKPSAEPLKILLEELPDKFHGFDFLIKSRRTLEQDKKLNFDTAIAVGKLYDAMLGSAKTQTTDTDKLEIFENLNKLCVRLVFCLYAESAGVFSEYKMFRNYLNNENNTRRALLDLFEVLNTPLDKRSPYLDDDLKNFPYVDGGLFDDEKNFDFPNFSSNAKDILKNLSSYKWQEINPTIFGAVFESTLNQDNLKRNIRREEGIHYTTPSNIQKVIKPLFLDELYEKFNNANSREDLFKLQNEIANIKILDPACGSGNFLTETYILLRELENKIFEVLIENGVKFTENPIKVSIENFYGIEINAFAVAVAKTALWISEIQMRQTTAQIINLPLKHFPLAKIPNIICANALTFDWQTLILPKDLNFIVGNPPFIGRKFRTPAQTAEIKMFFDYKDIDYIVCWFKKAADFVQSSNVRCAFVTTNSICQGEQVAPLWKNLNVHIDFAYKNFKWYSESQNMASVHVVIIGFSQVVGLTKKIFEVSFETDDGNKVEKISYTVAQNINAYLLDAPNVFIEHRTMPVCNVPPMKNGNVVADDGNLIIDAADYEKFIKLEPAAKKYIKNLIGAEEFINGKKRYCLWLVDCPPDELRKMKLVFERVKAVKEYRLHSSYKNLADKPALFRDLNNPKEFLILPVVSSEKRYYMPIGYSNSADNIVTNAVQIIPNAEIYHFGVLTSNVHMAWMRAICGRLEISYRYSKQIVYNNFVWCSPTEKQRAKIESTAQKILDVRAGYPNATLADLYNEISMPPDLRRAHKENDAAVMAAYGFSKNLTEAEIVGELFKKYLQLTGKN